MKWVEIITLRSPEKINRQFVDEIPKGVRKSDLPIDSLKDLEEIKVYHHSMVDTDLSIHPYWKSEPGGRIRVLSGLRFICSKAAGPVESFCLG